MRFLLLLSVILLLVMTYSLGAWAQNRELDYNGRANWNEFRQYVQQQNEGDEKLGLGYMISGTAAAVGGAIGYYQAQDVFSRSFFAITSSVGLAAIGLGATYYWTGSEVNSFFHALDGSSLSLAQKNELLQRYLEKEREQKKNRRWIRIATHSLIAAANFYSASQEKNNEVRSVFYFLGTANAVLALGASF